MSAILKIISNGSLYNICLIYNFKQVKDLIMVIMYVEKLHTWKQVFITYDKGAWDTSGLVDFTDDDTYQQVYHKLKSIFIKQAHPDEERAYILNK